MEADRTAAWPGGRLRRWLARYAPAEAAAIIGAVLGAAVADGLGGPLAATAFAGTIGEGIAFYGVIILRDLRAASARPGRRHGLARVLRDLSLEFGPAEVLDTLAARPLAMYVGPLLLGDLAAGIILGKVAADIVFYTLAIVGFEARQALGRRELQADLLNNPGAVGGQGDEAVGARERLWTARDRDFPVDLANTAWAAADDLGSGHRWAQMVEADRDHRPRVYR